MKHHRFESIPGNVREEYESECGAYFWDNFCSVPNFREPFFRVDNESGDEVAKLRWESDFAQHCHVFMI